MPDQESDRAAAPATDPSRDPLSRPDEPGAYVGNRPERQADDPGGITDADERIAAHSTQADRVADDFDGPPERREAGESR